ncbi:MAG TPA: DUF1800 domain-containing protein [Steroidobacteraceae bacterium]|nr:DUF1800 domain-containing protein [Steroidobacteraceae bacterium]
MRASVEPAIATNRYGLGARPGDLAHVAADPRGWLLEQLAGGPPQLDAPGLRGSADILADALAIRRERRDLKRAARTSDAAAAQLAAAEKVVQLYRPIYLTEATVRLRAAVETERPFIERLVHFWSNHFAVSIDKLAVLGLAGAFEREAIRPHVLGTFTELTLAVEQHPAMLIYLDNQMSAGPDSPIVRRAERRQTGVLPGINENLAREIMELHTLGVDGGYTQADVTTFAKVISGWSIGGAPGRLFDGAPGRFKFRPALHEPGPQTILGERYDQPGIDQGIAVLTALTRHPATARHIAGKLVRHFAADDPPATAVERIAQVFLESNGDLRALYRALIESPEPWAQPLAKFKTPSDYVISTYRGLELPVREGKGALASFEVLGQRTYSPGSPAGWPDRASDWDGASAVLQRVEWSDTLGERLGSRYDARALAPQLLGDTLSARTRAAIEHAASASQALTLLLAAPEFVRR